MYCILCPSLKVTNDLIRVPEFPQSCLGVLWDIWPLDKNVFVAFDDKSVVTFVYVPESVHGNAGIIFSCAEQMFC